MRRLADFSDDLSLGVPLSLRVPLGKIAEMLGGVAALVGAKD
jgi:hypothetical protein